MRFFKLFLLLCLVAGVTACGIKPKQLTPPSADEKGRPTTVYPHTYPDPTL